MLERPRLTVLSKADLAEGDAALGKDREKFIKELKKQPHLRLSGLFLKSLASITSLRYIIIYKE
jgi:hypothetical protein